MTCPHCDNSVIPSYDYCPKCGGWLLPGVRPVGRMGLGASPLAGQGRGWQTSALQSRQDKDSTLAFVLEILPGMFGFLGVGHMYSGNIVRGVTLLVCYWLFAAVEIGLFFMLIGLCFTPLNLIIPLLSAYWVKRELDRSQLASAL